MNRDHSRDNDARDAVYRTGQRLARDEEECQESLKRWHLKTRSQLQKGLVAERGGYTSSLPESPQAATSSTPF